MNFSFGKKRIIYQKGALFSIFINRLLKWKKKISETNGFPV